jgi:hypothetical protein
MSAGMARSTVAYLVVVGLAGWALGAAFGSGGSLVGALAIGLIPAMALTIELVHRVNITSRLGRSIVGAASWAAWGGFVAIVLGATSGLVLVPEVLVPDLGLLAASGAAFSLLAFGREHVRPSRAMRMMAIAVSAFVVLGSIWMAGRWGGPV